MTSHRYSIFGLRVASEIALPDLSPVSDAATPDVRIRVGAVAAAATPEPIGLYMVPHGAMLHIPEAGRYLMTGGTDMLVEPAAGATDRGVRLFLLGSAFAAILHQRHLFPLHANVIDFGGAAVAFMGHSGAGKSTLASWFHDRGLPILGDDVCVVRDDDRGVAVAEPGLPRIRLWGDALAATGRMASDYAMSFDDMDKYDVPLAVPAARAALPLKAIYDLRASADDAHASIGRLTGAEAIQALAANTYRGGYLPLMSGVARNLAQCVSLSRRVPVFALHRRWGLDRFADEAARVEEHVRGVLAGARVAEA